MNTEVQTTAPIEGWTTRSEAPVHDGAYFAILRRPTRVPFVQSDFDLGTGRLYQRINFAATDLRRVDDGTSYAGHAYGFIESRFPQSSVTSFLNTFGLYTPYASMFRRVRSAKRFIASNPEVVVVTRCVGYSRRRRCTVARFMTQFPKRADRTYEPF